MLLPSAQSFSSEGHKKAKRAGTDSKAGVGSAFISVEKKPNPKCVVDVQANPRGT